MSLFIAIKMIGEHIISWVLINKIMIAMLVKK
jgi:hypothetical protein